MTESEISAMLLLMFGAAIGFTVATVMSILVWREELSEKQDTEVIEP